MSWSEGTTYPGQWSDTHVHAEPARQERKEPIGLVASAVVGVLWIAGLFANQLGMSWIPQVAAVGLALLWLGIDVVLKRTPVRLYPPFAVWLAWMVWEVLGNMFGVSSQLTTEVLVGGVISTVKVFLIAIVVANAIRTHRHWLALYIGLALFTGLMLAIFRENVAEISRELERGVQRGVARLGTEDTGGFGDANAMSLIGSFCLISGVALFLTWKGSLLRWLGLATTIPTLTFLGYLGSRTGMAMIPVLACLFWFLYLRKEFRGNLTLQMASVAMFVVMLLGLVIWIARSPFAYRFAGGVGTEYQTGRLQLARVALRVGATSPIIGHGSFGYRLLASEYGAPPGMAVHNSAAEMFVRGGLPGFVLYYTGWFLLIRTLWRLRKLPLTRRDDIAVNMSLLMIASFLGFSLTLTLISQRVQLMVIGACVGYAYSLHKQILTDQTLGGVSEEQGS